MRWVARLAVLIVATTAMLATALGLTVVGADALRGGVSADGLPDVTLAPLAVRSEIVAADGSLLANLYEEDRMPVPLATVPKVVIDAVIATEDAAFYDHDGVSVRGVLRAVKANITGGEVREGGSTITQQLVKNSMLEPDRTYDRKAREAVLAYRMEQQLSKDEILEHYLNTVYFGEGAHGIASAAERFFGKGVADLGVAEAALLAGLISSPEAYDPIRQPEAAGDRRAHVLRRMTALGSITAAQAEEATAAPLPTTVRTIASAPTSHFAEEVRRQLLADTRLGATPQERFNTVFRGGIRVETTLDPAMQAAAEHAVTSILPASPFTAALVAVDPRDGGVKALVGGPNFTEGKFDLATQAMRQPGSSFKTIALAAWIADGRSPEDLVDASAPCSFPTPDAPEPVWNVDNYDGGSGVLVTTLRDATVRSANCAYARVSLWLGAAKLAAMAKTLGAGRDLEANPSIVLGSGEVTPLEMASMYATLAADGVRRAPVFVRRVLDRSGQVILENSSPGEQVIDPQVARTVTDVLRGVVTGGTGTRAAIGRPVAGKTGTAQAWRDAWFAGYTPQLAAAVWMGHPESQQSMVGVGGINVTGGSFPAQIWSAFMGPAMAPLPVEDFVPPNAAAWPPRSTIGALPPGVPLPPGVVLPGLPTTTTTVAPTTTVRERERRESTTTTERRKRRD